MAISWETCYGIIIPICFVSMFYAIYNAWWLSKVDMSEGTGRAQREMHEFDRYGNRVSYNRFNNDGDVDGDKIRLMKKIGRIIAQGSNEFLMQEYKIVAIFLVIMAIILWIAVDLVGNNMVAKIDSTLAFLIGAVTSIVCGYIGMKVAVYANTRTAYMAQYSLEDAFVVAFRAGCVMGFFLTALGLFILLLLIIIYKAVSYNAGTQSDFEKLFEGVAGYGLGGSTIALFGRVGGGIYTKAADVGADIVGKVEEGLPEDSPKNPATIADNVGDNVGDVAGMGADLFGSFAESTCAALVILSSSADIVKANGGAGQLYPLMITALGIVGCILTSFFATDFMKADRNDKVESLLKYQLIISSVIISPLLYLAAYITLPSKFTLPKAFVHAERTPTHAFLCTFFGLWAGLAIGYFTDYMTSAQHEPVQQLAESCQTGAATNIIYGLALGYYSTVVPIVCLTVAAYLSYHILGTLGMALTALGMLSNLSVGLAIDCYGPISDNAGGIAEMSDLGEHVRERTDCLDAAGNTTAAIGKGFAIGSAALVSLSLFGAFVTRANQAPANKHKLINIDIMDPLVFSGLLIGAMLPYLFSAMTMKSVGKAALQMVNEVRRQLRNNPGIKSGEVEPDYKACVRISTRASLREMIAPGALVIVTPLLMGFLFGTRAVAGLLPGALFSGVQMAIASSNSGGAWDNAKKFIEGGRLVIDGKVRKKGSEEHKAAVIGDTVGDPLKDTSGPSLNILVKLMAILSLVFVNFFVETSYLVCPLGDQTNAGECL